MIQVIGRIAAKGSHRFLASFLMLLAVLVLAACGALEAPTPQPADTPIPTATTAPLPESAESPDTKPTEAPVPTGVPAPTLESTRGPVPTATPLPYPLPTATPVPLPTATPEMMEYPTPTPIPTSTADATPTPDQLEVQGLSGREVMAMLTTEETDCIKRTFGEDLYNAVLGLNITSSLVFDPSTRFLLSCITQESINKVGLALIAADAQLSTESAACILEVLQESPGATNLGLGRLSEDVDSEAVHLLQAGFLALQCLGDEEAMDTLDQLNVLLGAGDSLRGKDIIAMLDPSETACVHERVDSSVLGRIQDATVVESLALAQPMFGCIGPETLGAIFARVIDSK